MSIFWRKQFYTTANGAKEVFSRLLISNKKYTKSSVYFLTIVSLCLAVGGISREFTVVTGQILANCVLRYRNVYLDALQQAIYYRSCLLNFTKQTKTSG